MFKDRMLVWVLEYIFGGMLVIIPLTILVLCRGTPIDTYIWALWLFVACLGVILISCASSMRQRMLLARRIDKLAKQITGSSESSGQNDEKR